MSQPNVTPPPNQNYSGADTSSAQTTTGLLDVGKTVLKTVVDGSKFALPIASLGALLVGQPEISGLLLTASAAVAVLDDTSKIDLAMLGESTSVTAQQQKDQLLALDTVESLKLEVAKLPVLSNPDKPTIDTYNFLQLYRSLFTVQRPIVNALNATHNTFRTSADLALSNVFQITVTQNSTSFDDAQSSMMDFSLSGVTNGYNFINPNGTYGRGVFITPVELNRLRICHTTTLHSRRKCKITNIFTTLVNQLNDVDLGKVPRQVTVSNPSLNGKAKQLLTTELVHLDQATGSGVYHFSIFLRILKPWLEFVALTWLPSISEQSNWTELYNDLQTVAINVVGNQRNVYITTIERYYEVGLGKAQLPDGTPATIIPLPSCLMGKPKELGIWIRSWFDAPYAEISRNGTNTATIFNNLNIDLATQYDWRSFENMQLIPGANDANVILVAPQSVTSGAVQIQWNGVAVQLDFVVNNPYLPVIVPVIFVAGLQPVDIFTVSEWLVYILNLHMEYNIAQEMNELVEWVSKWCRWTPCANCNAQVSGSDNYSTVSRITYDTQPENNKGIACFPYDATNTSRMYKHLYNVDGAVITNGFNAGNYNWLYNGGQHQTSLSETRAEVIFGLEMNLLKVNMLTEIKPHKFKSLYNPSAIYQSQKINSIISFRTTEDTLRFFCDNWAALACSGFQQSAHRRVRGFLRHIWAKKRLVHRSLSCFSDIIRTWTVPPGYNWNLMETSVLPPAPFAQHPINVMHIGCHPRQNSLYIPSSIACGSRKMQSELASKVLQAKAGSVLKRKQIKRMKEGVQPYVQLNWCEIVNGATSSDRPIDFESGMKWNILTPLFSVDSLTTPSMLDADGLEDTETVILCKTAWEHYRALTNFGNNQDFPLRVYNPGTGTYMVYKSHKVYPTLDFYPILTKTRSNTALPQPSNLNNFWKIPYVVYSTIHSNLSVTTLANQTQVLTYITGGSGPQTDVGGDAFDEDDDDLDFL